ncbi:DUF357 domain-containing protein [Candidatus Woesearchaeota archaeon]|nr:DUF357 domain-containing protein [Candidatus Woesearchaeota archaeon]
MNNLISEEKLHKYFSVTEKALALAKPAFDPARKEQAADFFQMAYAYFSDARHFHQDKQDLVLAFAALNYAHGWLDAGARIGLFQVRDSSLFTVDDQQNTTKQY